MRLSTAPTGGWSRVGSAAPGDAAGEDAERRGQTPDPQMGAHRHGLERTRGRPGGGGGGEGRGEALRGGQRGAGRGGEGALHPEVGEADGTALLVGGQERVPARPRLRAGGLGGRWGGV